MLLGVPIKRFMFSHGSNNRPAEKGDAQHTKRRPHVSARARWRQVRVIASGHAERTCHLPSSYASLAVPIHRAHPSLTGFKWEDAIYNPISVTCIQAPPLPQTDGLFILNPFTGFVHLLSGFRFKIKTLF